MSGSKKGKEKLGKGLTAQVHRLLAVAVPSADLGCSPWLVDRCCREITDVISLSLYIYVNFKLIWCNGCNVKSVQVCLKVCVI